jgi:hypothetical protein
VRRVLVVGQAPGRTGDPTRPFDSRRGSGRRLAELAGVEAISDVADVVNVLDSWPGAAGQKGDRFPMGAARRAAARVDLGGYDRVLLIGRGVAAAFGVSAPFLVWFPLRGAEAAVVPHPSGVNHWWNDGSNKERARGFFREVFRERGAEEAEKAKTRSESLPRTGVDLDHEVATPPA